MSGLRSDLEREIRDLEAEIDDVDGQIQELEEEKSAIATQLTKAENQLATFSSPSSCPRCDLRQEPFAGEQEEHLCCPCCGYCALEAEGYECREVRRAS